MEKSFTIRGFNGKAIITFDEQGLKEIYAIKYFSKEPALILFKEHKLVEFDVINNTEPNKILKILIFPYALVLGIKFFNNVYKITKENNVDFEEYLDKVMDSLKEIDEYIKNN